MKSAIKGLSSKPSADTHAKAQSRIDTALKKGIISKQKAARLKQRVSGNAKTAKVNLSKKSTGAKTASVKKTTSKKTTKTNKSGSKK